MKHTLLNMFKRWNLDDVLNDLYLWPRKEKHRLWFSGTSYSLQFGAMVSPLCVLIIPSVSC